MIVTNKIPLPDRVRTSAASTYPFSDMQPGDSFPVSKDELNNVRVSACTFGKRHGKKFSVRQIDGNHRCWRVE